MKKAVLILGIVSLVVGLVPLLGTIAFIPAVVGLVLGAIDISKSIKEKQNATMDIIGVILSSLSIIIILIWLIIMFSGDSGSNAVNSTEYIELQNKLNEALTKNSELSKEEKQEEIKKQINDLEKSKNDLTSEIESLNNTKSSLETTIEKLKNDVIVAKGEPRNYPAGYLTAGTDFDIGRYKIYNGNSNFIVYSSTGDLRVNIILGDNFGLGVEEYVYTFKSGDQVQASSSFTMIPVN